jgi:hypothetical protein
MVARWQDFDVYMYDEFDVVKDNVFSHEILLLTESTIKINFKKIIIKKV